MLNQFSNSFFAAHPFTSVQLFSRSHCHSWYCFFVHVVIISFWSWCSFFSPLFFDENCCLTVLLLRSFHLSGERQGCWECFTLFANRIVAINIIFRALDWVVSRLCTGCLSCLRLWKRKSEENGWSIWIFQHFMILQLKEWKCDGVGRDSVDGAASVVGGVAECQHRFNWWWLHTLHRKTTN